MALTNLIGEGEALADKAKAMWDRLHADVASGVTTIKQATTVTQAVITAVHDVHTGSQPSIMASIEAKYPEAIPIAEALVGIVFGPEASSGLSLVLHLLAMAHPMSPEEEKAWMDRASANY